MNKLNDVVLSELVKKKKSLLDRLLVLSIQSVVGDFPSNQLTLKRSDLLSMLERNDAAIQAREQQTGLKAIQQETGLFSDIALLISSIQENNRAAISKLELAEKEYEREKTKLGKGKKLSGYVFQSQTIGRYQHRQTKQKGSVHSSLVKGTV